MVTGEEPTRIGPVVDRIVAKARETGRLVDPDDEPDGPQWRGGLPEWLTEQWAKVIPEAFQDAETDHLIDGLRESVDGWVRRPGPRPNLVLLGPTGCGKTYAAVAAVRSDFFTSRSVVFYSVPRLLFDLRPGSPVADRAADYALRADRLILDDVGAERDTDWTHEQLWLVVNERYNSQDPIVVTSNLALDVLADRLGERIASRLLGGAVIVDVGGRDRRRSSVPGSVTTTRNGDVR